MRIKVYDLEFEVEFIDVDVEYWSRQIRPILEDFYFVLVNELKMVGTTPSEFLKLLKRKFGLDCPKIQISNSFSTSFVNLRDGIVRLKVPVKSFRMDLPPSTKVGLLGTLMHEFRHLLDFLYTTLLEEEGLSKEWATSPGEMSALITEIRSLLQMGVGEERIMEKLTARGYPEDFVKTLMSYASKKITLESAKVYIDPYEYRPETGEFIFNPELGLASLEQLLKQGDVPPDWLIEELKKHGKEKEMEEIILGRRRLRVLK